MNKCGHTEYDYKCGDCIWNRQKNPRCIHNDEDSCFHCRFNDPYLAKGIDPNPPMIQHVPPPRETLWVENQAVIYHLIIMQSQLDHFEKLKNSNSNCDCGYDGCLDEWCDEREEYDPIEHERLREAYLKTIRQLKKDQEARDSEWEKCYIKRQY